MSQPGRTSESASAEDALFCRCMARHRSSPFYRLACDIDLMLGISDGNAEGIMPDEIEFGNLCNEDGERDVSWRDYEKVLRRATDLRDEFELAREVPDNPPPTPQVGLAILRHWNLKVDWDAQKRKPIPITAEIARRKYEIGYNTLRRAVNDGRLTDHRKLGHAPNSPLLLDENEVKSLRFERKSRLKSRKK